MANLIYTILDITNVMITLEVQTVANICSSLPDFRPKIEKNAVKTVPKHHIQIKSNQNLLSKK